MSTTSDQVQDQARKNTAETIDRLRQSITERKQLLGKIAKFISEICREKGKMISLQDRGDHTSGEYELKNFLGFSFHFEWCWTNHYEVRCQDGTLILDFEEHTDKIEVHAFSPDVIHGPLLHLIDNKDAMIREAEEEKRRQEEERSAQAKEQEELQKLQEEALKLLL